MIGVAPLRDGPRDEGVTVSRSAPAVALRTLRFVCAAAIVTCAMPLLASRPYLVDNDVVRRLERGAAPGEKLILERVPVIDGNPMTLELEHFEVWAPDAKIIVYEADGKSTHTLARPATQFYRGRLVGEPDSVIALSVEPNGHIEGKIFVRDRIFFVAGGVAQRVIGPRPRLDGGDARAVPEEDKPLLVAEFEPAQDLVDHPESQAKECEVERIPLHALRQNLVLGNHKKTGQDASVVAEGVPTTGVSYGLTLALETDGELYAAFGDAAAVTAYLGNLIAQASVIYHRDLNTTLTIGPEVHLWSNANTDPWTVQAAAGAPPALFEFGTYWHAHYASVARSSALFISGKPFSAGVAWENVLCACDFSCRADGSSCTGGTPYPPLAGVYGGAYAFCGSSGHISTTTPDQNSTVPVNG